jgi:hypothetical protein
MNIFTIKERIESMTDDELVSAATIHKEEYTLDALQIINAVLTKREIPVRADLSEIQKKPQISDNGKEMPTIGRFFAVLNLLTAAILFVFALMGMSGNAVDFPIIMTVGGLMCSFSSVTIYLNNKYKKKNNKTQKSR